MKKMKKLYLFLGIANLLFSNPLISDDMGQNQSDDANHEKVVDLATIPDFENRIKQIKVYLTDLGISEETAQKLISEIKSEEDIAFYEKKQKDFERDKLARDQKEKKDKKEEYEKAVFKFVAFIIIQTIRYFIDEPYGKSSFKAQDNDLKTPGMNDYEVVKIDEISETFSSIVGNDEAKEKLTSIVKNIEAGRFKAVPKGILLVGEPGTGKTALVRALAKESGIPFINADCSEMTQVWQGTGAMNVRKLFEVAESVKKPVIIFLDEIDSVGRDRKRSGSEDTRLINTLLTKMDGFKKSDSKIIIIAATNNADLLDPALKRAGRFNFIIETSPLNYLNRIDLLQKYTIKPDFSLSQSFIEDMARKTQGFTGAELAGIVQEATRLAEENESLKITEDFFIEALHSEQKNRKYRNNNLYGN